MRAAASASEFRWRNVECLSDTDQDQDQDQDRDRIIGAVDGFNTRILYGAYLGEIMMRELHDEGPYHAASRAISDAFSSSSHSVSTVLFKSMAP